MDSSFTKILNLLLLGSMSIAFQSQAIAQNEPKSQQKRKVLLKDETGKVIPVDEDDPRLDPIGRKRWLGIPSQYEKIESEDGEPTFRFVPGVETFLRDPNVFEDERKKFIEAKDPIGVVDPDMQDLCAAHNLIFSWTVKDQKLKSAGVEFGVSLKDYEKNKLKWLNLCDLTRNRIKSSSEITPEFLWKESLSLCELVDANKNQGEFWGVLCLVRDEYSYSKRETRKMIRFEIRNDIEKNGFFLKQMACRLESSAVSSGYPGPLATVGKDSQYELDHLAEVRGMRKAARDRLTPDPLPPDDGLSIAERKSLFGFDIVFEPKADRYHFENTIGFFTKETASMEMELTKLHRYIQNAKLTESQLSLVLSKFVEAERKRQSAKNIEAKFFRFKVVTDDDVSTLFIESAK